jgi:acetyl esterase/lipase
MAAPRAGGFRAGKRESHVALCVKPAESGYVAIVSYRLALDHQLPASVHDVKVPVRWLRAHADEYRTDPSRIVDLGTSAGGSLAQLLGVTSHAPRFEVPGRNELWAK